MNNLCICSFPYCNEITSIQFINKETIYCSCLNGHTIQKNIEEEIKKNTEVKENLQNYTKCSEHNINYHYYCKNCNINICNYCKNKHNNHNYFSLVEKIPSNNIFNSLGKYLLFQKTNLKNINKLFNELITTLSNQFNTMYTSLNNYLQCHEKILNFSKKFICHYNSINNINYLFNKIFPESKKYNNQDNNINYEDLKTEISNIGILKSIEKIYNYLGEIFISTEKKITDANNYNNSEINFSISFNQPCNITPLNEIKVNEYKLYKNKTQLFKNIHYNLTPYKILNEHVEEIRNIISLDNGFFVSSSLDCNIKIFNSLTGEIFCSFQEPYNDQICYIIKLKNIYKNEDEQQINLLILSRHLIFIKFNILNNDNEKIQIMQSIDNNGVYISQAIQLNNLYIITYDDNNEIKIYTLNNLTQTYILYNFNINNKNIEYCSFLEIKPNIFAASSNSNLENGENCIKIFDINNLIEDGKNKIINNLNCSTGRDSMTMIKKNILCVGLQFFDNEKNNKNFVNGIALIDINLYEIIQIIEDYRVHSICLINLYICFDMLNKDDFYKKENLFLEQKLLGVAGYDEDKEIREIKLFKIIEKGNESVELSIENEIFLVHEGFINSIKWLGNGILVTGSSDQMISLFNLKEKNDK